MKKFTKLLLILTLFLVVSFSVDSKNTCLTSCPAKAMEKKMKSAANSNFIGDQNDWIINTRFKYWLINQLLILSQYLIDPDRTHEEDNEQQQSQYTPNNTNTLFYGRKHYNRYEKDSSNLIPYTQLLWTETKNALHLFWVNFL